MKNDEPNYRDLFRSMPALAHDKDPKKYHNPVPMTPDQLDKIADRLGKLAPRS